MRHFVKSCVAPLLLLAPAPLLAADPAPAVPSVQHFMIGLSVADIDAMTAWYGTMLGFKVTKEAPMPEGGGKVRFIENGNARIELIYQPGAKAAPARGTPPAHAGILGPVQITLEVPDLDAARAALAARGVTIDLDITPLPPLGIRILFLRDPEGNLVELVQRLAS